MPTPVSMTRSLLRLFFWKSCRSTMPSATANGQEATASGAHLAARYKELGRWLDCLLELADVGHYPQVEMPNAVAS